MASTGDKTGLGTESIGKLILRFSIPSVISFVLNGVYNIVDQIYIGQSGIGMLGIAATNISFPLVTLCTAVALLLGIGGAANISLNLGRGDREKANYAAGNSISSVVIAGVAIAAVCLVFLRPLMVAFGSTDTVLPYAMDYTWIVCLGFPFMMFTTGACQVIRADGSPNYSMVCMVSGALFNIVFDPVFAFTFGMGIQGIALATTLSQVLSSILCIIYLLKRQKLVKINLQTLRPRFRVLRAISALGAAACVNQLAMAVVQIALNNVLRHYGAQSVYGADIPLSAVGAISKILFIMMAFPIGIAQGCQPIFGFNFGAKKYDRVRKACKIALLWATVSAVLFFAAFQIFPRQIIGIFGEGTEEYYAFAIKYMRIYLLATAVNGIQPVASNFFTSIGKASKGLFMSLTRQTICLLPLILILPVFWGIDGVMYAGPIADAIAAVLGGFFILQEFRRMRRLEAESGPPAPGQPKVAPA